MTRHLGIVTRAHHVSDRARGQRPAGGDSDKTVGRDAARWDPLDDAAHRARPWVHARIMPKPCRRPPTMTPKDDLGLRLVTSRAVERRYVADVGLLARHAGDDAPVHGVRHGPLTWPSADRQSKVM
jgi:hypothetical protein